MFVSVIELSPGSTLIELPLLICRPTYDQWNRWGRSSLLLDVPFWDCNRNGFFCFPSFTFWQRARGFLVKVSKWLSWTVAARLAGHHFVLGWNVLSNGLQNVHVSSCVWVLSHLPSLGRTKVAGAKRAADIVRTIGPRFGPDRLLDQTISNVKTASGCGSDFWTHNSINNRRREMGYDRMEELQSKHSETHLIHGVSL